MNFNHFFFRKENMVFNMKLGQPHGGTLVDRRIKGRMRKRLEEEAKEMPRLAGNERILSDIWQIAIGGFSPLTGFMVREDYESVVQRTRLSNDLLWAFPIVLPIPESLKIEEGDEIAIFDNETPVAIMQIEEIWVPDKKKEVKEVIGTTDPKHPGVQKILSMPNKYAGGPIYVINRPKSPYPERELEPRETRKEFQRRGWKEIVAFQTRNPPHMAHLYLQRIALEIADGLFIHPIIGERKPGDFPPQAIIEAYNWIAGNYWPKERVFLSFLWTWMRFAAGREALHHLIIRKNYGATAMVIGRLHASVSGFHRDYEAHEFIKQFDVEELGIRPLLLHGPRWCPICKRVVTDKTCPHKDKQKDISMTYIRKCLRENKSPPEGWILPEIIKIVKKYAKSIK